ncbi:MAG: hypothetical protein Ct9H300mP18_07030 [Candidatus Neomarinimicrobiota bacterium]|nr:MAG: hypothetical protein Ct9H300mP18_07030 [Candidatus Neomarinimicrobiota bacterium]
MGGCSIFPPNFYNSDRDIKRAIEGNKRIGLEKVSRIEKVKTHNLTMNILLVEPYYTGSHKSWAKGVPVM